MAGTTVQRRRGTTAQHSTFTGAVGEITVDTDKKTAVIHDGATAGGFALQRADQAITNATNATNLTGSGSISSTTTATTQSWGDNSTKVGTTAYADALRSVPVSTTTGTAVIGDKGKCISLSAGITIPASVFSAGDIISLYNNTAADITITQGSGLTLRKSGSTTTGNMTLALRGIASIWFLSATEAIMSGAK